MSAFPFPPVMAKDLIALTIQGLTYDPTDGSMTPAGSPTSLRTTMDNMTDDLQTQHHDIHAHGAGKANHVPMLDDATFSVTVFLDSTGADYNKLRALWSLFSHFRISFTRGVGASAKVETFDMARGNLTTPFQGDGGQQCTATFLQADTGSDFRTRTDPS